jgi:hypothetical protein
MRLLTATGEFDLPANFAAQLARYNVLLSSAGEQTAPITLPPTPTNLKLVGWSDRIDASFKPLTDIDVTVSDDLFVRNCNLGILSSPSSESGISCTLYFATGDFYSRVGDAQLGSLAWPVIKHPDFDTVTDDDRVGYLVALLKSEYLNPTTDAIFGIAPVLTTQEFTYKMNKLQADGSYKITDITGLFILNGFERYQHILNFSAGATDYLDTFEGEFQQTLVINSVAITVGKGYGMTPFLKLRYMIGFIFDKYGYTVDMSSLDTIVENFNLSQVLVYNNVADAIFTGTLKFKQLVPDVKIKEFISEFETRFAGKFIVDNVQRKATFVLFDSTINQPADVDLSEFACARAEIDKTEFTALKIKDKSDTSTTTSDEKTTAIEIELMSAVTIADQFSATGVTGNLLHADLSMLQGAEIIQLNTQFQVDKKASSSADPKPSTLIQYMYMDNANWLTSVNTSNVALKYKTSYRLFHASADPDLTVINNLYKYYKDFRLNSNVALKPLEMNIEPKLLDQMRIHVPKLLQGQKVMIENISQPLGIKGTQTVTFRTLRSFNSRTQYIGVWGGYMCELNGLDVNLKDIFISATRANSTSVYVGSTDNVTSDISVQVKVVFSNGSNESIYLTIPYGTKQSGIVYTHPYGSLTILSVTVLSITPLGDTHANYYIKN